MIKKTVLTLAALVLCVSVNGTEKPNVLMLLVDDLKPAIGDYGDCLLYTSDAADE